MDPQLPPDWPGRYQTFATTGQRPVALHDCDADGVSSAVIWQRTLERAGKPATIPLATQRQRNAWNEENRHALGQLQPDRLFLLDLGCKPEPILAGVPTFFVDHHRPDPAPPDGLLLSGYELDPIPTTSWLVYELGRSWVDLDDLLWVAAVGIVGDLGEKAPLSLLAEARTRYPLAALKEVAVLVNAARRASEYAPWRAREALARAATPSDFLTSEHEDLDYLRRCRREVASALAQGKKAAPRFSGPAALICVDSPCQIHPLLAQIWRSRLPRYYVLVANTGYVPGKVHFSARSTGERNVLDFLRAAWPERRADFGHGHDRASGGALELPEWREFLSRLGFGGSGPEP